MTRLGLLLGKPTVRDYGAEIAAAARANGAEAVFLHLPDDPNPRLEAAALAQVHATFLSRDVRFSPQFEAFEHTMTAAPNLRWVHFVTSGMNPHPWVLPLLERGVRMSTSTGSNAEPVSQIALMGLLLMARRAHVWIRGQQNHQWLPHRGKDVPPDIAGQTVIIVGLGAVGSRVARHAQLLGLKVIGVRRSARRPEDPVDELIAPAQLKGVLPQADFLVLTCPLTPATRNLIDAAAIASLKPTAAVINVSRGEVIDEAALIDALQRRGLAGAYLDVYQTEPLPAQSPLWDLPNVVMSPHNASSAQGNDGRATRYFIENVGRLLRGEPLVNEYKRGDEVG
jgi:phosphoglycerate dehydrogenase-like enzyme